MQTLSDSFKHDKLDPIIPILTFPLWQRLWYQTFMGHEVFLGQVLSTSAAPHIVSYRAQETYGFLLSLKKKNMKIKTTNFWQKDKTNPSKKSYNQTVLTCVTTTWFNLTYS